MYKNEKVFESEKSIRYLFQKSYQKTKGLVIVFSAFHPIGKEPRYNYVRTLAEFDCNKLFILDDFGCRASYYLCENRDFSIERSVIQLINKIIEENGVELVITCGSSKGGYAALYYGIKYGFDHVIAASPQYLLGDYLTRTRTEEVISFMAGANTEEDYQFLNKIMKKMIHNTERNPHIFIHLGEGEYHYTDHVIPLIKDLEEKGITCELDLGDYDKHSDVIKFYPNILKNKIRTILDYPKVKLQQIINKDDTILECEYKVLSNSPTNKVAWYVYKDNKKVDTINYGYNQYLKLSLNEPGTYKIKAFVINEKKLKVSIESPVIKV
ncbi:YqiA/YcfP family alpha/beta fold hydrolase [Bacillus sp. NPDC077027]|uniref:YqiA/YcfP family alpha/beta fold hydrolase n=1 Tax=Bacillus sp. NPDC077027 TaxID=3390548 RepID=UPI003D028E6A